MTTLMFHKRFIEPIQAGTKKQTIRPPRKRPIKVGDELALRYWVGKGYRSPQATILYASCTAVFSISINAECYVLGDESAIVGSCSDPAKLDEFARADGFESWADMMAWYRSDGYGLPFEGVLIQWGEQ